MRRASRGRFEVPLSWSDVEGNVPLESCVLGWVGCVGGVGLAALGAVAGGVEMPFCSVSAATGEAMVRVSRRVDCPSCACSWGLVRRRQSRPGARARRSGLGGECGSA